MRIKLSLMTALLTPLIFTACGSTSTKSNTQESLGKSEISECFSSVVKDSGAICKYITLKAEPDNSKDNREVKVYYSVINPLESNTTLDPVVFLVGGPGGSANIEVGENLNLSTLPSIVKNHKLILVDYRGTGFSEPYADCRIDGKGTDAALKDSLDECTQKMLALGIKPTDYTSKKIAGDIDKILEVEEIDQAILYGTSYGTRVALTMSRDYPQRVSAMVLDGVFTIEANGISQASESVFEKYSDLDKKLKAKYPDDNLNDILNNLKDKNLNVLQLIGQSVLQYIYQDDEESLSGNLGYMQNLDKDGLYKYLITDVLPKVVYLGGSVDMIHSFNSLDEIQLSSVTNNTKVVKSINPKYKSREGLGAVMAYSVILSEEFNFMDEQKSNLFGFSGNVVDALKGFAGGAPLPISKLSIISDYFKVGATDPIEKEPVTTDIPTLLFSGGKDMQTTKSWAVNTQKYLANSSHHFYPSQDHVFSLTNLSASDTRDLFMMDYTSISGSSYKEVKEK